MIVTVTNLKGGVGKSTVTQNLAVYFAHRGFTTCILDSDFEAQICVKWNRARQSDEIEPKITSIAVKPDELAEKAMELREHFDMILIDGTPALFELSTTSIVLADIVVFPVIPSLADIWTLESYLRGYKQAKSIKKSVNKNAEIHAFIVVNKFNDSTVIDKEILDILGQFEMETLQTKLRSRVVYKEALAQGRGVIEMRDQKAKREIQDLGEELEAKITSIFQ
jgi:chromosome partitioning protein